MSSTTLDLARELIQRESVTPNDAGCLNIISQRLEVIGFTCHILQYEDVTNLWAVKGESGPLLAFAGHTDVVPTGPVEQWQYPPFAAELRDGMLYGRGAADMKGSLAAMVTACERFLQQHQTHSGRIGFLLTSDEEGPAINGTVKVMEWLAKQNETIDWCIIGEPTSDKVIGDIIKNGRRGSLNFKLVVHGQQGHIAYPHLANNPIHLAVPALTELTQEVWDNGNEYFPATSFQFSNIHAGTGATNVIPGDIDVVGNFRFSTEVTADILKQRTESILRKHNLEYTIDWQLSGQPFLTPKGTLVNAVSDAIKTVTASETTLSTTGGTSDGRFIAPYGVEVLELGPCNATIHKINECVSVADIEQLSDIYYHCLNNLVLK